MTAYRYEAKTVEAEFSAGVIDAASVQEATEALGKRGLFPTALSVVLASRAPRGWFRHRVSPAAVRRFTRQLADLLEAHVALPRAFQLLQEQEADPSLRSLLQSLSAAIHDGQSLSQAMGQHPRAFSTLYVRLVQAGEAGGQLRLSLNRLADFLEQQSEFKSRVFAAVAYPGFVAVVGFLTVCFLMLFAVPRLSEMFADSGTGLPWMAQLLERASDALRSPLAWSLATASALCAFGGWRVLSPQRREKAFSLLIRVPVWGAVWQKTLQARFAKTLAMLLNGGVSIVAALEITAEVMDHAHYRNGARTMSRQVAEGSALAEATRQTALFPAFFTQMIGVGEETHSLESTLERMAAIYERETDRALKLATSLLEPLMIVVVGGLIGFIVLGMLLPILQISTSVR